MFQGTCPPSNILTSKRSFYGNINVSRGCLLTTRTTRSDGTAGVPKFILELSMTKTDSFAEYHVEKSLHPI